MAGSTQCVFAFDGDEYRDSCCLEIEDLGNSQFAFTLSTLKDPAATRHFRCHYVVLAVALHGKGISIFDNGLEVALVPTYRSVKMMVRDLKGPADRQSFVAEFKIGDLNLALACMQKLT
jgi:hypothetical protein